MSTAPFATPRPHLMSRGAHQAFADMFRLAALEAAADRDPVAFERELRWYTNELDCLAALDVLVALPRLLALAEAPALAEAA